MTPPVRLASARERLDDHDHDSAVLAHSLDQLASVNRWLGGTRAVLRALLPLLPGSEDGTVLDVGTGSADVPRAIVRAAQQRGQSIRITCCDLHPQTVRIARDRTRAIEAVRIVRGDALALPFHDGAFDVALLSLTLHHFDDEAQRIALRELARVARRAVIVNELHRSWPNYLGARLLGATLWRSNPITRHDGPVSVLRAFTPAELLSRARAAGLDRPHIERRFFYRVVLVAHAAERCSAAASVDARA